MIFPIFFLLSQLTLVSQAQEDLSSSLASIQEFIESSAKFFSDPAILPEPTYKLVEKAGYKAEDYFVPTSDGYVINLVRIINPLIKKHKRKRDHKKPIVFIHGLIENANCWLVMGVSEGQPHDWSHFDAANLSESQLKRLIGDDRTSRAFPFLLSNFGFDVWLMNRRNTLWSRDASPKYQLALKEALAPTDRIKHSLESLFKLKKLLAAKKKLSFRDIQQAISFNFMNEVMEDNAKNKYYNFSYDEQAKFDLPCVFNFILDKTKHTKLNVLGHSAGGLLTLMLLASQPEWNSKSKFDVKNHLTLGGPR